MWIFTLDLYKLPRLSRKGWRSSTFRGWRFWSLFSTASSYANIVHALQIRERNILFHLAHVPGVFLFINVFARPGRSGPLGQGRRRRRGIGFRALFEQTCGTVVTKTGLGVGDEDGPGRRRFFFMRGVGKRRARGVVCGGGLLLSKHIFWMMKLSQIWKKTVQKAICAFSRGARKEKQKKETTKRKKPTKRTRKCMGRAAGEAKNIRREFFPFLHRLS